MAVERCKPVGTSRAGPCAGSGFISSGQQSDHLLMVAAYNAWEDAKAQVQLLLLVIHCMLTGSLYQEMLAQKRGRNATTFM